MDLVKYLERIKCEHLRSSEPSLENLNYLQNNHLKFIPFENLDIMYNKFIDMELNVAFEKVIEKNRGGFCFELNNLFGWLLKQLGYELEFISCRVYRQTDKKYYDWFSHIAILVNLNSKTYLVDVGFSYPNSKPLDFVVDKIQKDMIGSFKIEHSKEENCFTLLRNNIDGIWDNVYQFDTTPRKIEDFQYMLKWVQSKENPRFYNRSFCIRLIENGIMMVIGFKQIIINFKDSKIESRSEKLLSIEEVMDLVRNNFQIFLDSPFVPQDLT